MKKDKVVFILTKIGVADQTWWNISSCTPVCHIVRLT